MNLFARSGSPGAALDAQEQWEGRVPAGQRMETAAQPAGAPPLDLSAFDTAFCDSLQALAVAYAQGLPRTARILSRAPALLVHEGIPVVDLDTRRRITDGELEAFYFSGAEFLESRMRELEREAAMAPFARLICRELWTWQQTALHAIFLTEDEVNEPRLVIEPDLGDQQLSERVRFPWVELLQANPRCALFKPKINAVGAGRDLQVEPLLVRVRIRGVGHIAWRLAERLSSILPAHTSRGTLYFIKENELIRECAMAFASRGYRIARLKLGGGGRDSPGEHRMVEQVVARLRDSLRERLIRIVPDFAFEPLVKMLRSRLSNQFHAYDDTRRWLTENAGLFEKGRTAIITNFPTGGAMVALAEHAARSGVVFAGAQHGITREILDRPQNQVVYENLIAPYFLSISRKGEEITQQNAFVLPQRRTVSVGLPADYRRAGRPWLARWGSSRPPIIYAQMLGSAGPRFNGQLYRNDFRNYRNEARLLKDVFGRLPHRILFKPYPSVRYADPEPILDVARRVHNIEVDTTGINIRFLFASHRVIVVSVASSTLSWCINSGLPVIYIDPASYGARLSAEVRNIFEACAIYFDEGSPSFYELLREFLEQPIEAIEARWSRTADERRRRLGDYFGRPGRPGKTAYRWLREEMRLLGNCAGTSPNLMGGNAC